MEFNEKLQELRKNKGMTQEELAEVLFVSRTAISKWESGRGYPNIDSLKEISKFFSVTIDELLSGDRLISIAENENKSNLQRICGLLIGILDLFSFVLIILPLYPKPIDGYIYSVNLFSYTEISSAIRIIYWGLLLMIISIGIIKIIMVQMKRSKWQQYSTAASIVLSIFLILFLAITRETYAITVAFLLFVTKGLLLYEHDKS